LLLEENEKLKITHEEEITELKTQIDYFKQKEEEI
jgi:hypothetical protein